MNTPAVVLVGQTPPPVHGQALAIERLVRGHFSRIVIHHVPMDFSGSMEEVGRVRLHKIPKLVRMIWRVLRLRFRTDARILYYPPAGPALVPVLRDILFLNVVRPFFPTLVLDIHAGGLDTIQRDLGAPLRFLFRRAYHGATLLIERYPSDHDPQSLRAQHRVEVPYGIEDEFPRFAVLDVKSNDFTVLYVGLITGGKGIWTLLEAMSLLQGRGVHARMIAVGEFASDQDKRRWVERVQEHGLQDQIRHAGKLEGDAKWREFRGADVFCFPSQYENEAFPLAIIEAMQFRLPVVASNWRGIPYLVQDEKTGYLVQPGDAQAVAERLARLAADPEMRARMGVRAREVFLERYTDSAYLSAMEEALVSIARSADPSR